MVYVLGVSWTTLTNNTKGGFSCLIWGFVHWSLALGDRIIRPDREKIIKTAYVYHIWNYKGKMRGGEERGQGGGREFNEQHQFLYLRLGIKMQSHIPRGKNSILIKR